MTVLHLFLRQSGTRPIHVTIPKRFAYFWEVSAFLAQQDGLEITSIDCVDPSNSTFDLARRVLSDKPRVLVLLARVENLRQTVSFSQFIKSVDPSLKIIVYGDIVNLVPDFFAQAPSFDAAVVEGDWEAAIMSYVDYVRGGAPPVGLYVHELGMRFPGINLRSGWSFSDLSKVPLDLYARLDGKRQLTLTAARGCPYNCRFCLSTCTFGIGDRRARIEELVDCMEGAAQAVESFKLFAPTFNADNGWVRDFCGRVIERNRDWRWCASSRVDLLDDQRLVELMARAGCYKISVGLETINRSSKYINKEFSRDTIERVARSFERNGVVLKGLVMLGVPYQTRQDVLDLFRLMREHGIKIRPTSYSPLDELRRAKTPSLDQIVAFDKFTYYQHGIEGVTKEQYYRLLLFPNEFETTLG